MEVLRPVLLAITYLYIQLYKSYTPKSRCIGLVLLDVCCVKLIKLWIMLQIIKWTFYLLDVFGAYVCVNLRGFAAVMPQKLLDISQIRSAL